MSKVHGHPVWFELSTLPGQLGEAGDFYAKVLGWTVSDAGMEGFTYHLGHADGAMVAGLIEIPDPMAGMPPNWTLYFGVDDINAAVAKIRDAGGQILTEPAYVPGTGHFAVVADPQGAGFGIMQMDPMEDGGETRAFDQTKAGHGNWTELMTSDPDAGYQFYADLFGWTKGDGIPMGDLGTYQLFRHDGADIGGMMGIMAEQHPAWMIYFGVNGVNPAIERIKAAGGTVHHGPQEVPGGAHIAITVDPQGAWFAVVGPLEAAF